MCAWCVLRSYLLLQIGAVQGAAQFLCQLSKGVSGVAGDVLGSQVGHSSLLLPHPFSSLRCCW